MRFRHAVMLLGLLVGLLTCAPTASAVIYTVDATGGGDGNCAGDGDCELADAIIAANTSPGMDDIHFAAGGVTSVLTPGVLVDIDDPVRIDGRTEDPGVPAAPPVTISGSELVFAAGSDGSEVRGLAIEGNSGTGLTIESVGVVVQFNRIGSEAAGDPTNHVGIDVAAGASAAIGGTTAAERNVVSGNTGSAQILVGGPSANRTTIQGNYLGLTPAGTAAVDPTLGDGIILGGFTTGNGPLIRDNAIGGVAHGVFIPSDSAGTEIQGNYFGTSADGLTAVPNQGYAIWHVGDRVEIEPSPTRPNVLWGNGAGGIRFEGTGGAGPRSAITGNLIGTRADGSDPGAGANGQDGIELASAGAKRVDITGNTIQRSTEHGIHMSDGSDVRIGGTTPAETNDITQNGIDGVNVTNGLTAVAVLGNTIENNTGGEFVRGDRPGPTVSTAETSGGTVRVAGTHSGLLPNHQYRIDVYRPDATCEMDDRAGSANVTTNGAGVATFDFDVGPQAPGQLVSVQSTSLVAAVPTDSSTLTCRTVAADPPMTYDVDDASGVDDGDCLDGDCTLVDAINDANASAGADSITFSIGAGDMPATVLGGALPPITDSVTIDGRTQYANPADPTVPPIVVDTPGAAGFQVLAEDVTLRGLVIGGHGTAGIDVSQNADGLVVEFCYIGLQQDGSTPDPNGTGIRTDNAPPGGGPAPTQDIRIGGPTAAQRNVISGNTTRGILLADAEASHVQGNYIGTDATGNAAAGTGNGTGIVWEGESNGSEIGGATPAHGNVISGNTNDGVLAGIYGDAGAWGGFRNNRVGVGANGSIDLGNGGDGVEVDDYGDTLGPTSRLHIGATSDLPLQHQRNVISGNTGYGVRLNGLATMGNAYVGLAANGSTAVPNGLGGVQMSVPQLELGGFTGAGFQRNVIAGNGGPGVDITAAADGATVRGAFLGVTANGQTARGNANAQVRLTGVEGAAVQGSLISGGLSAGGAVGVRATGTSGLVLSGNQIGLNDAETGALNDLGNSDGIVLAGGSANTGTRIEPVTGNDRPNTISGNTRGIVVGPDVADVEIMGNRIGVGPDGTGGTTDPFAAPALPNTGDGIVVQGDDDIRIGSADESDLNRIAFNGGHGLSVEGAADDVSVLGNSFASNVGQAIDIGDDGPDANDGDDLDGAPNERTNHPFITRATASAGNVRVLGQLGAEPNQDYRIEIFQSSDTVAGCEGERFLVGSSTVQTNGAGIAGFDLEEAATFASAGEEITATATELDTAGDAERTSEFGPCEPIEPGADLRVTQSAPATSTLGSTVAFDVEVEHVGLPGESDATNVELVEELPSNATVVSLPPGCSIVAGDAECSLPDLSPGDPPVTRTFVLRPTSTGAVQTVAFVRNDEVDGTPGDRIDGQVVQVQPPPPQPPGGGGTATAASRQAPDGPAPPPPPPPPPTVVEAEIVEGTVTITLPDGRVVSPADLTDIPVGSRIDATKGKVRIVYSNAQGSGDMIFYDGVFVVGIAPDGALDAKLRGAIGPCATTSSAARGRGGARAAQKRRTRKLWGDGKGRFRVSGKHSAAVVRGTTFMVEDRCDGTLTDVRNGSVVVRDFAIGLEPVVAAGRQYLARNRPLPQRGRTVNLVPTGGAQPTVRLANGRTLTLTAFRQVPATATVDATRGGGVRLVTAGADVTQFARFSQGAFRMTGQQGLQMNLVLADPPARGARARGSQRRRGKSRARKLWGDGKGSFKVTGKHSAAVVRGTRWLVQETDEGTLTRVTEGVVTVEDFGLRRTVTVTAGNQYLAER